MKTAVSAFCGPFGRRAWAGLAGLALGLAFGAGGLHAQVTVKTLGGGHADYYGVPYGFVDGDTLQQAMYNTPASPTLGPDGNLWIAESANGAIRKLLLATGQTRTVMTNLNQPVGVISTRDQGFYVLTRGDGAIRRYDTNLNLMATITTALVGPNAFTMDSAANFFVAQSNGVVVRVSAANPAPFLIGTNLSNPGGIAITLFGNLAVSDTGNHVVKVFDPAVAPSGGSVFSGTGVAGFKNGEAGIAQYNAPAGIAQAPNGQLVVSDRLNHRVRLVYTNGYASTLYGVGPENWVADPASGIGLGYKGLNVWPGWADGPYDSTDPWALYPASMDPVGICIGASNILYTTEWGYHLVRQVTGVNLASGGGGGGGGGGPVVEPVDVPEPAITPDRGYFPNGQSITVGSTVPDVFYTLDGTTPTTNSPRVTMNGNRGSIWWNNPTNDLSNLRVRAYVGTNASEVVAGVPTSVNTIGVTPSVTGSYMASPGSTLVLPVVVNLIPGAQMRSVFYRVEVRATGGAPSVSDQFRLVPVSTNDFITMVGMPNSTLIAQPYGDPANTANGRRGLLVSAVGTNLGGVFTSFGTLNMVAIPIPSAPMGSTYTVSIINPSATTDGAQAPLTIVPATSATVVVGAATSGIGVGTNNNGGVGNIALPPNSVGYLVGDSSPSGWYNAGEFGDGNLNNADVNNAFYASLGLRVPPSSSDAFDAMDAFPVDVPGMPFWGGDGEIRFLDWQIILQRASRLDENNFIRVRDASGAKSVIGAFPLTGSPDLPAAPTEVLPGNVWVKQAQFIAGIVGNAQAGQVVEVPVYVRLRAGSTLSGLSFSAAVRPATAGGVPVTDAAFVLGPGAPAPSRVSDGDASIGRDTIYRVWEYIPTGMRAGDTLLGHIRFTVPAAARSGDVYRVRFLAGSGGDTTTTPWREPQFESLPGAVYVGVAAPGVSVRISDEWKRRFFGDVDSPEAANDADPDHDGVPNWQEFLAGTNPATRESHLRLRPVATTARSATFNVLTSPQRTYQLEYVEDLRSSVWTSAATLTGDGRYQDVVVPTDPRKPRFYRLRLLP